MKSLRKCVKHQQSTDFQRKKNTTVCKRTELRNINNNKISGIRKNTLLINGEIKRNRQTDIQTEVDSKLNKMNRQISTNYKSKRKNKKIIRRINNIKKDKKESKKLVKYK